MESELREVYMRFATFGNRSGAGPVLMDGRACQKLAKDCGIMNRSLTATYVDLIFTKCKTKGQKRIDFDEFVNCTRHWAEKLGLSHAEVVLKIIGSEGPKVNTLVPGQGSNRSIRSDASNATSNTRGSDAKPRVMARLHPDYYEVENPNATGPNDRYYYVNRITKETTWMVPYLTPSKDLDTPPPPSTRPPSSGSAARIHAANKARAEPVSSQFPSVFSSSDHRGSHSYGETKEDMDMLKPRQNQYQQPQTHQHNQQRRSSVPSGKKKASIFDKLTDPSQYTGAHRHRFDPETGKGRGLAGRDNVAKGRGSVKISSSGFRGHTNTGTDEKVDNIASVLRPGF
ncbi:Tubulin polymerization-promoting protein [Hondaea fermentalgiana]|uniref:Tubulin polymerization-promoting protein n=1 Tax=Hondaea fermentalgiana TaxID=2315210 RepID=A0A2R5GMF3_9STRA|nr:Tubulin polymerization-promoting protein [Hondaea fermentalgiana]|eukprot:GBG30918.1 Tubulin polymerization-promoting protein [Hondaea fermentalgiana]